MKKGDRVVNNLLGTRRHGKVVKMRKATALVRFDGHLEDESVPIARLYKETAEDVARRDREVALRAWRECRPNTTRVRVERLFSGQEVGATLVGAAREPEEMRQAARELLQLADWFADRPVSP